MRRAPPTKWSRPLGLVTEFRVSLSLSVQLRGITLEITGSCSRSGGDMASQYGIERNRGAKDSMTRYCRVAVDVNLAASSP
jgi:hypothetical protein